MIAMINEKLDKVPLHETDPCRIESSNILTTVILLCRKKYVRSCENRETPGVIWIVYVFTELRSAKSSRETRSPISRSYAGR